MKKLLRYLLTGLLLMAFFSLCKRDDDPSAFQQVATPAFVVYQEQGNLEHLFSKCISEDIILDTVIVTDPLNLRYNRYFNGQIFNKDQEIDLGDTFVPTQGKWSFIFRGKKAGSIHRFAAAIDHTF